MLIKMSEKRTLWLLMRKGCIQFLQLAPKSWNSAAGRLLRTVWGVLYNYLPCTAWSIAGPFDDAEFGSFLEVSEVGLFASVRPYKYQGSLISCIQKMSKDDIIHIVVWNVYSFYRGRSGGRSSTNSNSPKYMMPSQLGAGRLHIPVLLPSLAPMNTWWRGTGFSLVLTCAGHGFALPTLGYVTCPLSLRKPIWFL